MADYNAVSTTISWQFPQTGRLVNINTVSYVLSSPGWPASSITGVILTNEASFVGSSIIALNSMTYVYRAGLVTILPTNIKDVGIPSTSMVYSPVLPGCTDRGGYSILSSTLMATAFGSGIVPTTSSSSSTSVFPTTGQRWPRGNI